MYKAAIISVCLLLLASCATTPPQTNAAVLADLAPTGKMRVGINYGNPVFAAKGAEGGGIAVDLAQELGRQLGVPVELVSYNSGGQLTAGLAGGGWDVAISRSSRSVPM